MFLFIGFISSIGFSFDSNWTNYTSQLNPTSITKLGDTIYASTMGGVLELNTNNYTFDKIIDEDGLDNLDLSLIGQDKYENLWLGGTDGSLQIFHPMYGLQENINNLNVSGYSHFDIADSISFIAYNNDTELGVLKFIMDEEKEVPLFVDYFRFFPIEFDSINDIGFLNDSLYVATNNGLLVGNYSEDILNFSQSWNTQFVNSNIQQIEFDGSDIWIIQDSELVYNSVSMHSFENETIDFKIINSDKFILTSTELFVVDDLEWSFQISDDYNTTFTSMVIEDNMAYFGLFNHGILILNIETGESSVHIPNTLMTNSFEALTFTENNTLVGVGMDGLFLMDSFGEFNHIIPMSQSEPFPTNIDDTNNHFQGVKLNFEIAKDNPLFSIIETSNINLLFGNKGVRPHNSEPITKGAVFEINPTTFEFSIYDTTDQIIDAQDGIYTPLWNVQYMVISQIQKDHNGNAWILNPMGEYFGNMLSIQHADGETWSHVKQPDDHSYWANSIAFDNSNRAWFGIRGGWGNNYTTGGLRVLQYSPNLNWDETDTTWIEINNQYVLPGGSNTTVFSCVIDNRNDLWVLTGDGVQGYSVSGSSTISLSPLNTYYDYLYYASFEMGDRIRVDARNNKWIITHNGVWVIQDNHTFWPDENGINSSNSEILSDVVLDIAFDEENGNVYFATDKGISKLKTPFANSEEAQNSNRILFNPNPYILPNSELFNAIIPFEGATVKIMQLNGRVLVSHQLEGSDTGWNSWNGRNSQGQYLSSGVYLVTASTPEGKTATAKLAIILR